MFHTADAALEFVLAGRAIITLSSQKTGAHYTYQINRHDQADLWFLSLLTGPNNTSDFTYIGLLKRDLAGVQFTLTKKSKLPIDATPVAAFRYFLSHANAGLIPSQLEVRHEGRCGRCCRTLTVPESLDRGIGPECAQIIGRAA